MSCCCSLSIKRAHGLYSAQCLELTQRTIYSISCTSSYTLTDDRMSAQLRNCTLVQWRIEHALVQCTVQETCRHIIIIIIIITSSSSSMMTMMRVITWKSTTSTVSVSITRLQSVAIVTYDRSFNSHTYFSLSLSLSLSLSVSLSVVYVQQFLGYWRVTAASGDVARVGDVARNVTRVRTCYQTATGSVCQCTVNITSEWLALTGCVRPSLRSCLYMYSSIRRCVSGDYRHEPVKSDDDVNCVAGGGGLLHGCTLVFFSNTVGLMLTLTHSFTFRMYDERRKSYVVPSTQLALHSHLSLHCRQTGGCFIAKHTHDPR